MSQYDKFAKEYIAMRSNMFKKNMTAEFPVMLLFQEGSVLSFLQSFKNIVCF